MHCVAFVVFRFHFNISFSVRSCLLCFAFIFVSVLSVSRSIRCGAYVRMITLPLLASFHSICTTTRILLLPLPLLLLCIVEKLDSFFIVTIEMRWLFDDIPPNSPPDSLSCHALPCPLHFSPSIRLPCVFIFSIFVFCCLFFVFFFFFLL